jgi:aromatic-L-amino-acid decarboxylase
MFQLTYANRSIKTWAAVARLGRSGVRELVIRCNRLAQFLDGLIRDADDMELLAPTSLSVVNFRFVPAGQDWSEESLSELNKKISTAISDSGEAHIPTTKVNSKVSLRACVLHYENNEEDMRHLLEQVRRQGLEMTSLAP